MVRLSDELIEQLQSELQLEIGYELKVDIIRNFAGKTCDRIRERVKQTNIDIKNGKYQNNEIKEYNEDFARGILRGLDIAFNEILNEKCKYIDYDE